MKGEIAMIINVNKLAKIEQMIEEVCEHGEGKLIIVVEDGVPVKVEVQTVRKL